MRRKSDTREALEEIYQNLQLELDNVEKLYSHYPHDDTLTDFDFKRLYGSLENAVEMFGEELGFITYEDDD